MVLKRLRLSAEKKGALNCWGRVGVPGSTDFQKEPVPVVAKPAQPIKSNLNPLEKATLKEKTATSDGFKTFNNIPISPDVPPPKPGLSKEQELREKLSYLRKLEALEKKGITLTKKYSMESSLDEMKGEYEMIKADKEKQNSVKFQQKMLLAFVSGLEFLNGKFDPFDLKLDGWSEGVNENIDEYDVTGKNINTILVMIH